MFSFFICESVSIMYRLYIAEHTDKKHTEKFEIESISGVFIMLERHLLSTNNTKISAEYMIIKEHNGIHGDSVLMIYKTLYRQLSNIYGKDAYKEMKLQALKKDKMLKGIERKLKR